MPREHNAQLWRTAAAAVGNTIYVTSQMADSRRHEESTKGYIGACVALPAYAPLPLAAATAASAASVK